jgi:invasion protein IalB
VAGAAVALLAAFGVGVAEVLAQQSPEPPAGQSQASPPTSQPAPPATGEAAPELEITERQFQDWMVRCGRATAEGPEVCEMQQQATDDDGRPIMAVAVGTVPGTSDLGLLIMLPLGILLPAGVALQVDGGAEVPLEVQRCERQGCRIERLIEPELLNRLKAGRAAKVFFGALDPQGQVQRVNVPVSLLGFTAALSQLTG